MTTVTVKVEIPDGWERACDTMRPVEPGEYCIGMSGEAVGPCSCGVNGPRVIVRKSWQWPEWLTCAAVVRTKSGNVWACSTVPHIDECMTSGWANTGLVRSVCDEFVNLDYPEGPWRDSRRLNLNRKGNA